MQPNKPSSLAAEENRYEGSWKNNKKNGPGKFFYLDRGQLYEGVWVDDIPKCGEMTDFGRDGAPAPTQYPIPKVTTSKCTFSGKFWVTSGGKGVGWGGLLLPSALQSICITVFAMCLDQSHWVNQFVSRFTRSSKFSCSFSDKVSWHRKCSPRSCRNVSASSRLIYNWHLRSLTRTLDKLPCFAAKKHYILLIEQVASASGTTFCVSFISSGGKSCAKLTLW